jgi:hypothetical protein
MRSDILNLRPWPKYADVAFDQIPASIDVFFRKPFLSHPRYTNKSKTLRVSVAMLHFPEAMKTAQAELDSVCGDERMPTFDDSSSLPYVHALLREIMRQVHIQTSSIDIGEPNGPVNFNEDGGLLHPWLSRTLSCKMMSTMDTLSRKVPGFGPIFSRLLRLLPCSLLFNRQLL